MRARHSLLIGNESMCPPYLECSAASLGTFSSWWGVFTAATHCTASPCPPQIDARVYAACVSPRRWARPIGRHGGHPRLRVASAHLRRRLRADSRAHQKEGTPLAVVPLPILGVDAPAPRPIAVASAAAAAFVVLISREVSLLAVVERPSTMRAGLSSADPCESPWCLHNPPPGEPPSGCVHALAAG